MKRFNIRSWFIPGAFAIALMGLTACDQPEQPVMASEPKVRRMDETATQTPSADTRRTTSSRQPKAAKPVTTSTTATAAVKDDDDDSTAPRLVISGCITLPDGKPATGTLVSASKHKWDKETRKSGYELLRETLTAADGTYELRTTGTTHALLKAAKPGFATSIANVQPLNQSTSGMQRTHDVTKDIVLDAASHVRGKIMDQFDKPVTSATMYVYVEGENGNRFELPEAHPNGTGDFALADVPAKPIVISVETGKHVPLTRYLTPPADNLVLKLEGEGAKIRGNVFMLGSGRGVSSATVTIVSAPEAGTARNKLTQNLLRPRTTTTDDLGAYEFDLLPAGNYNLGAEKGELKKLPAERRDDESVKLAEKETTSGIDMFLYPGHVISGVVRDKGTSEPIEGALVFANYRSEIPSTTEKGVVATNSKGEYRLSGVFGAAYHQVPVNAAKKGYSQVQDRRRGGLRLNAKELEVTKNIEMMKTITLAGSVKTPDGSPVTSALVFPMDQRHVSGPRYGEIKSVPVDGRGEFELEVQPYSTVRVLAKAPNLPIAFSKIIQVADQSTSGADIVMSEGGTISGIVVGPDIMPVEAANVVATLNVRLGQYSVSENIGAILSDKEGRFSVPLVPADQDIFFSGSKKGFSSISQNVRIKSGELKSDVELKLGKSHFIAGRVLDKDGNPISGASVHVSSRSGSGSGSFTTLDDGKYRVEDLAAGKCYVNASHTDHGSMYKDNVDVDQENYDITLEDSGTGTITGKVVDYKSGQPITNFTVTTDGDKPAEKDPNAPGTFVVRGVRPRYAYPFMISAPGYMELDTGYLSVPEGQTKLEKVFKMGPGGSITGRVVAAADNAPLPNLSVLLRVGDSDWDYMQNGPAQTMKTDSDGRFRFDSVAAGSGKSVSIVPTPPLVQQMRPATVQHGETVDLGEIVIGSGGVTRGKVVRVPGDVPIPGATVNIRASRGEQQDQRTTKDDGSFEFIGLPDGDYNLTVADHSINSLVTVDSRVPREVVLRVGSSTLKGRVLLAGQGVQASVNMRLDGSEISYKSFSTKEDGTFEQTGLSPGTWKASVSASGGNRSHQENVEIRDGITQKDFVLPSGKIVGRVVDPSNQPIGGAKVAVTLKGTGSAYEQLWAGQTVDATSKPDGSFVMEGLGAGTYSVSASKSGMGADRKDGVSVPENGVSNQVTLQLDASKTGTLVSTAFNMTNGQPVPEAWCILSTPAGNINHGKTRGADGVVTIPDLPAGAYNIQVSSFGFSVNDKTVEVKAGETARVDDVLYEAGALRWSITNKDGIGLAGVPCSIAPDDPNSIERPRQGVTDPGGLCVIRGLYPGNYTGVATPAGKAPVTVKFPIQAHQLQTLTSKAE